ncbi:MAG: hypothetical protein AAB836_01305 [Patescibacteria group bacterium]
MAIDKYGDGIERGLDEGLIEICGKKITDSHAHYDKDENQRIGLRPTNTRKLKPVQADIAASFPGEFRYLDMGAGSGVSASEMSSRFPAEVHTLGLTPINPFLDFNLAGYADSQGECLAGNRIRRDLRHLSRTRSELISYLEKSEFPPQLILRMQGVLGMPFFIERDEPFIKKQFIGNFPVDFPETGVTYDFISDVCGPCLHSLPERYEIEKKIRNILSPRGVFYLSMVSFCDISAPGTIRVEDPGEIVFIKEENPLFEVVGGKNLQVQNLQKFIAESLKQII